MISLLSVVRLGIIGSQFVILYFLVDIEQLSLGAAPTPSSRGGTMTVTTTAPRRIVV
jgi:hypothetical protein